MFRLRPATEDDVDAMTRISNAFIGARNIEWTQEPHGPEARLRWFRARAARGFPVLVAEQAKQVIGYGSYGDFRDSLHWPGYARTVEHTLHVAQSHWRAGVGRALIEALLTQAKTDGKHMMIGAISGDNPESIAFHARLGFTQVARLPEVGYMRGAYLDLILMLRTVSDTDQATEPIATYVSPRT